MSRPKSNLSTLQEAWLDGATDTPCFWAIIVPPLQTAGIHNTDPARRTCYIVAGETAEQAINEAKAHTRLFSFWDDVVTECRPTTRAMSELECRNALRVRGYVVQIVVRLDAMDRKINPVTQARNPRVSDSLSHITHDSEYPACWGA